MNQPGQQWQVGVTPRVQEPPRLRPPARWELLQVWGGAAVMAVVALLGYFGIRSADQPWWVTALAEGLMLLGVAGQLSGLRGAPWIDRFPSPLPMSELAQEERSAVRTALRNRRWPEEPRLQAPALEWLTDRLRRPTFPALLCWLAGWFLISDSGGPLWFAALIVVVFLGGGAFIYLRQRRLRGAARALVGTEEPSTTA